MNDTTTEFEITPIVINRNGIKNIYVEKGSSDYDVSLNESSFSFPTARAIKVELMSGETFIITNSEWASIEF